MAEVTIDEARRGLDEREERPMSIGDLAGELGVTTRTIRFYEVKGLIAPRRRNDNARVYGRRDRGRLILILRAKNLGFTLEEIREYLDLYDADPSQLTQTKHLIGKVQAAIADLKRKRADIDRSLQELEEIEAQAIRFLGGDGKAGEG